MFWSRVEIMGFRDEVQRRLDKKRAEISILEGKVREAEVYAQALEDMLKLLPKEETESGEVQTETLLREGSNVSRAKEILQKAGHPMHITELLSAMGKPRDKDSRSALAGTLGPYVRRNEIFTR